MKLSKKVCGALFAASLVLIPAPQPAEAGFLNEIGKFFLEEWIDDPEAFAMHYSDEVLDALWKSSVLMEESKLCLAEALQFNPKRVAACKESIRQMTFDRNDMNAIRTSTYNGLSEDALKFGVSQLLSDDDRAMDAKIQALMKKSQAARHASHSYNKAAIGHIIKVFHNIGKLKEKDPQAAERVTNYFVHRLGDAYELLKIQRKQSEMFHEVFKVFNRKYNVKEPTKKEIKRIEKELLPS